MFEEEVIYHEFARIFTDLLEGQTPDKSVVQDIKVRNAPKRAKVEATEEVEDIDLTEAPLIPPFHFVDTYEGVKEEWRRNHPRDGQLTTVQVDFITGDVNIRKKLNAAEKAHGNKNRGGGREWDSKKFNLSAPNGVRNAASYAFR